MKKLSAFAIYSLARNHKIFHVQTVKFSFQGIQNLAKKTEIPCDSMQLLTRRMHSIYKDLEGIAVFLARLCIPAQLGQLIGMIQKNLIQDS